MSLVTIGRYCQFYILRGQLVWYAVSCIRSPSLSRRQESQRTKNWNPWIKAKRIKGSPLAVRTKIKHALDLRELFTCDHTLMITVPGDSCGFPWSDVAHVMTPSRSEDELVIKHIMNLSSTLLLQKIENIFTRLRLRLPCLLIEQFLTHSTFPFRPLLHAFDHSSHASTASPPTPTSLAKYLGATSVPILWSY